MANYAELIADINDKVYENTEQKITGTKLNSVLNNMVTKLGAGYAFIGKATPTTTPIVTDAKVFYVADEAGDYELFDESFTINAGQIGFLYCDTAWHLATFNVGSAEYIKHATISEDNAVLTLEDEDGQEIEFSVRDYAKKDGYYEQMGVGVADNLAGKGDGVPAEFTDRPTGGTADVADGVATLKAVKGNTIVWNQLVTSAKQNESSFHGTYEDNDDGTTTYNYAITDQTSLRAFAVSNSPSLIAGHKYLYSIVAKCEGASFYMRYQTGSSSYAGEYPAAGFISGQWSKVSAIAECQGSFSGSTFLLGIVISDSVVEGCKITLDKAHSFSIIDLTQMFGAGTEPTTVAEFEALFPNDYYAYNAGQLLSLNMTGIKTDGFNQAKEQPVNFISEQFPAFDKNKYTRVLGGQVYYLRHDSLDCTNWRLYYKIYDLNGNLITNNAFTEYSGMPPYYNSNLGIWIEGSNNTLTSISRIVFTKDCYVYFGFGAGDVVSSTKMQNFCINLSHSGVRNGEYEPYWTETRNIPVTTIKGKVNGEGASVVIFPDGMRSAGTVHDEIVGNKAIKRIGVVDLGSLSWERWLPSGRTKYHFTSRNAAQLKSAFPYVGVCVKYLPATTQYGETDKSFNYVPYRTRYDINIVDDSYSTAEEFKAAMSGVLFYYELVEPVEYIIDEADVPNYNYKVSDFGTETLLPEGVDASGVPKTAPIKAQIVYGMNAVDTLRNLPKNYISKESMDAILTAFKTAGIISAYTLTWDATNGKYNCTITPITPEA